MIPKSYHHVTTKNVRHVIGAITTRWIEHNDNRMATCTTPSIVLFCSQPTRVFCARLSLSLISYQKWSTKRPLIFWLSTPCLFVFICSTLFYFCVYVYTCLAVCVPQFTLLFHCSLLWAVEGFKNSHMVKTNGNGVSRFKKIQKTYVRTQNDILKFCANQFERWDQHCARCGIRTSEEVLCDPVQDLAYDRVWRITWTV